MPPVFAPPRGLLRGLLLGLLAAAAFAGAAAAQQPDAEALAAYEAEAEQVLQRLRGEMMREMTAAMQAGPAEAIGVCRHLAPQIEGRIEEESGWSVRRVALRVRDPANLADAEERAWLLGFEVRAQAGQSPSLLRSLRVVERDGEPTVHFMQAVPMMEGCVACHGEAVEPEVLAEIRALYPEDAATGYKVGEIRGAFSLYKPYVPDDRPISLGGGDWARIAALELPATVALAAPGREGDPAAGRAAFGAACRSCHGAQDLARHLLVERPAGEPGLCAFLETHGMTAADADCDIVAFLKVLAELDPGR